MLRKLNEENKNILKKYMNKLYCYIKNFGFNNFIISQYQLRHGGNKIGIFFLFLNKKVFEYINAHFRIIISLPLDDIMYAIHTLVLKNK